MRFLAKPLQPVGIAREMFRDELDRNRSIELLVVRKVHLAHCARADARLQPIGAERLTAQIFTTASQLEDGARAGFQEPLAGGVRLRQRVDALAEQGIGSARRGEKSRSFRLVDGERLLEQGLHALPVVQHVHPW